MAHVVAVADVSESYARSGAQFFFQREEVGKRLARMVEIGQRVDDWNARMRRQGVESLLRKYTRNDSLHPARQAPRDVGNRFALAQPRVRMIQKNCRAAEAHNADFKRDTRAQRRLFKNHRQESARESFLVAVRVRLDIRGQTKQLADLRGVPLRADQQVGGKTQCRGVRIHVYLAAASARAGAVVGGTACVLAGRSVFAKTESSLESPSFTCCAVNMNGGSSRRVCSCVQLMSRPCRRASVTYGAPSTSRPTPSINPSPRTSRMKSNLAASFFKPARNSAPRARTLASRCFRSTVSRKANPVAHTRGPPPNVEPWRPGENAAANSSRARKAPSGSPPASGFATTTMSGRPVSRW